jgi:predicted DNA-binding transcriptional regulator YafY
MAGELVAKARSSLLGDQPVVVVVQVVHRGLPSALIGVISNVRPVVDSSGPQLRRTVETVDTPARLLRLLVLFSSRPQWSAGELANRLQVTGRTLRRDVTRLRSLGYPIESATGPYGGYTLGAGGRLPPLLLDDDEAVAVSVGLRDLSRVADPVIAEAALAALAKVAQVLPTALRERVTALAEVTEGIGRPDPPRAGDDDPSVDLTTLMTLAMTSRGQERVRFDYRTGDGQTGRRHVEPHRLVSLNRRWYLVAFDLDRDDWRTFRIDRIGPPATTGVRATQRPAPDAAALVAEGVALRAYDVQAVVRVHCDPTAAARQIPPNVGVIEPAPENATATIVRIGGDVDWIARYLIGLPYPCEVVEPEAVNTEIRRIARRALRDHPPAPSGSGRHAAVSRAAKSSTEFPSGSRTLA